VNRLRLAVVASLLVISVASLTASVWALREAGRAIGGPTAILVAILGFVVVGGLIVSHRPGNWVGWLMALAGTGFVAALALQYYTDLQGVVGEPPAVAVWAAWLSGWAWVAPVFALCLYLPLYFPDGQLPSVRWRPVAWGGAVLVAVYSVVFALTPGPTLRDAQMVVIADNPVGIAALEPLSDALLVTGAIPLVVILLVGVGALVARWRRSRGVERLQLKWLAAAVAVLAASIVLTEVLPTEARDVADALALLAIPIAIGVAVLRYRLYEIDRIVSRTVSYGLLTALLVGVYVLGVIGFGGLVRSATGGRGGDLVVAASTLAVAALFGPARRRIQALVDRRFNRARYDAEQTVAEFTQWLRDEVDLAAVREALAATADAVVEPRSVGVWLRDSEDVR
jgi:hypothetical protein